ATGLSKKEKLVSLLDSITIFSFKVVHFHFASWYIFRLHLTPNQRYKTIV
ncbi:hypothetical protein SAMN05660197_1878, partial [Nitratiruptor tergarcus DSM 16512]